MKTDWDYTELAQAYVKRVEYSDDAVDRMLSTARIGPGASICDVGAGVAHLTIKLAQKGAHVVAVEPNDAMRRLGRERTAGMDNVRWTEGSGEATGQPSSAFDLVTFGSSFNVTDRPVTLRETRRILKNAGWFAAMWNHRDLDDPVQSRIEYIIKATIPGYDYGARREDQTSVIEASGLFKDVRRIEGNVTHKQKIPELVEAWRSHATLHRQAGAKFDQIIRDIENMLRGLNKAELSIPYTTRIWLAQAADADGAITARQ